MAIRNQCTIATAPACLSTSLCWASLTRLPGPVDWQALPRAPRALPVCLRGYQRLSWRALGGCGAILSRVTASSALWCACPGSTRCGMRLQRRCAGRLWLSSRWLEGSAGFRKTQKMEPLWSTTGGVGRRATPRISPQRTGCSMACLGCWISTGACLQTQPRLSRAGPLCICGTGVCCGQTAEGLHWTWVCRWSR